MHIILQNSSMTPLYEQVVEQIKSAIFSGELLPGAALPSVRCLSNELRISALTVKKAYDRLEETGYVVTVHGKGTYVTETDPSMGLELRRKTVEDRLEEAIEFALSSGLTAEDIRSVLNILMDEEERKEDKHGRNT